MVVMKPLYYLVPLLLLVFCACETEMPDPKGTLEKQAVKYWIERVINKNFEYTYQEEAREGLPPFSEYEKRLKAVTRIPTSSVKLKDVRIEGKVGFVNYSVTCHVQGIAQEIDIPLGDQWILKGNRWKHDLQAEMKTK